MRAVCDEKQQKSAVIANQVIDALGCPPDLYTVGAHNVYGSKWRINVWCETNPNSYLIKHSYFVTADGDDKIVNSNPPIKKTY